MIKEFTQSNQGKFLGKPVLQPIDVNTLSSEDKRKALDIVNLIKENKVGTPRVELAPMVVNKRNTYQRMR